MTTEVQSYGKVKEQIIKRIVANLPRFVAGIVPDTQHWTIQDVIQYYNHLPRNRTVHPDIPLDTFPTQVIKILTQRGWSPGIEYLTDHEINQEFAMAFSDPFENDFFPWEPDLRF